MSKLRTASLLAAFLALGACDQSPVQPQSASHPSATESASPAADSANDKDCATKYFYNFSDQRAGGKIVCSSEQQS